MTTAEPANITELRRRATQDARATVDGKSRQIRPHGQLPDLVAIKVRSQATKHQLHYQDGRLDTPDNQFITVSFNEVCRESRKTVLLGDLGSGKSTIVAGYVAERNENDDHTLAILAPCKSLRLQPDFRILELVASVGSYFVEQIWPGTEGLDLKSLLDSGVEASFVFDGLDELPRSSISHFVKQLEKLAGNWPNIQVIATGRPVELLGVSYDSWQVCEVCRLTEDDKREILRNEFIANGVEHLEADSQASTCIATLHRYSALNDVTVTPLAIRLSANRLASLDREADTTLGDLLFELAEERLSLWQQRDGRPERFDLLNARLPSSIEKLQLVGALALQDHTNLTRESCTQFFADYVGGNTSHAVGEEAFRYLTENGFLVNEGAVEFVFEPLKQVCAGAALLSNWCDSTTQQYDLDRISWRVAAFAATIARRRNLLTVVRPRLRLCLEKLLHTSAGVPPACYIVNESKDATLARYAIDLFATIGRRPLQWYPDEEHASARAIASTIVLAGNEGFEWLYNSYLDPRVPIMHRGSAVISAIFCNWVALVKDRVDDEQRSRLAAMANPYRAFDGMLMFLNKVVFLCPDEFTLEERLWLFAGQLSNPDFGDDAKNAIVTAFAGPQREIVNAILRGQASTSLHAALLYLELNESDVPREIAYSVIIYCSDRNNQQRIARAIERCEVAFGNRRWQAILRWCLTSEDRERRLNANAARLLFEYGDTGFEVLADALLDGMHDGLRAFHCEEYMRQLVSEKPAPRARVVANRISDFNDGLTGAHSGWWRLLLENLEQLGEDSPHVLVKCARSIGPFLLARNPDIRQTFRSLMKKESYYEAFKTALWDADPRSRFGVGMVLAIADPQHEAEAVLVTIIGRPAPQRLAYHEWDELFLSLDVGYSVQEYVHSNLDNLPPDSRMLALAMLAKNGFVLSDERKDELRTAHLVLGNVSLGSLDLAESHPSSQESCEQYKSTLKEPIGDSTRRAAELLLRYHYERLDPSDEAICWLILSTGAGVNADALRSQLSRLVDDSKFRAAIIAQGEDFEARLSTTPLLLDAARAIADPSVWSRVVWQVCCGDTGLRIDLDEPCHGVYEFALLKPEFSGFIGEAAKSFLGDPRINKSRFTDRYHWLVLLAAAFSDVSDHEIEAALCAGTPIHGESSRGLIALLGRIPDELPDRRRSTTLPEFPIVFPPARDQAAVEAELATVSLDSERLAPNVRGVMEDVVFLFTPSDELLESIAANGLHGKFIAQCLRFCFGRDQSLKDRVAIVRDPYCTPEQWNDATRNGLIRVQDAALRTQIDESPSAKEEYLNNLSEALNADREWNHAVVYEVLRVGQCLPTNRVEHAFCSYAKHHGKLHRHLAKLMVGWLSGELGDSDRDAVLSSARKAVLILNESPWGKHGSMVESPFPFLIFPLLIWRFGDEENTADYDVFVRGIALLFHKVGDEYRGSLTEPLAIVEPLLRKVTGTHLRLALERGMELPDPGVRAVARLVQSFATASHD